MVKTESILQEIQAHFGFIPPFLAFAQQTPLVLMQLWQQTQTGYIQNPLPALFKEKVFLYLSYCHQMPYDLRSHCITLAKLGMQEEEILQLLQAPHTETAVVEKHLEHLQGQPDAASEWPAQEHAFEMALFTCSIHFFMKKAHAQPCQQQLQRTLGEYYMYILALLSYIHTCHYWTTTCAELLAEQDETLDPHFSQAFGEESALVQQLRQGDQCMPNKDEQHEKDQHIEAFLDTLIEVGEELLRPETALAQERTTQQDKAPISASPTPTTPTPDATIQRLLTLTQDVLSCERIGVMLVDPETEELQPLALTGLSPELEARWWKSVPGTHLIDRLHDPHLLERIRNGEVLVLDSNQPAFRSNQNFYRLYNIHTWLLSPMYLDAHVVGLLSLDYGGREHNYTEYERHFAFAIARLMALVLERAHLLAEWTQAQKEQVDQLVQQEVHKRMNEFLSIAAHELRTPITTVKGSVQILTRRIEQEIESELLSPVEQRQNSEMMYKMLLRADNQINRLTRLINDIVYVTRMRAKKITMQFEMMDLCQVVREAVQKQKRLTPQRSMYLTLPLRAVPVSIDRERIEQVIANYLSNALKYSDEMQPIEITVQIEDKEAHVMVQDHGPGLSDAEQQYIWDRFYQAQETEVRSGSGIGLGLGLYISHSIIEEHGGSVGLQSAPRAGSTFWFTLPIADMNG